MSGRKQRAVDDNLLIHIGEDTGEKLHIVRKNFFFCKKALVTVIQVWKQPAENHDECEILQRCFDCGGIVCTAFQKWEEERL